MNFGTSLTVAAKELKVLRRKKSIMASIIVLPLLLAFFFSLYINQAAASASGPPSNLALGLDSLTYFFVVLASTLPASIAAYSIVGEKIEKSLEPLLATPVADGEILLGKSIAAFVPPILATLAGASIFMADVDLATHNLISYYYFPNWSSGAMLLLLAPLAAIFSIESAVIASSRVSDARAANQIGGLMFIPFMAVFVAEVTGKITFDVDTLLVISGIVLIVDLALFFLSKSIFKREEILTKWK
jgi:ABC-2 type transport system permease protein